MSLLGMAVEPQRGDQAACTAARLGTQQRVPGMRRAFHLAALIADRTPSWHGKLLAGWLADGTPLLNRHRFTHTAPGQNYSLVLVCPASARRQRSIGSG